MKSVLIIACLGVGCSSLPTSRPHSDVGSLVPIGTSMADATQALEEAGFETRFVHKGRFEYHERDDSGVTQRYERTDFDHLLCQQGYKGTIANGWVNSFHSVALALDDDSQVTEIFQRWEHVGL